MTIVNIRNMIIGSYKRFNFVYLLFISFLFGLTAVIFLHGWAVIDVKNINWILIDGDGDLPQHFVGWQVFRSEGWHFPITKINGLNYPIGTSVVYTDSIPVMAIFFKLVKHILPVNFQYFGIWCVIAYTLQVFFSIKIVHRFTDNIFLDIIISIFFLLSPVMTNRIFGHDALGGHFIVLVSIFLLINNKYDRTYLLYWAMVNIMTLLIHAYFIFITMAVWCGYLVNCLVLEKNGKYVIKQIIINSILLAFFGWILGYFDFYPSLTTDLFATLSMASMNLNALINPIWISSSTSAFLKMRPVSPIPWSHEGYAYLGAGIILMFFSGVVISIRGNFSLFKGKGKVIGLSIATFFTTIFALGTKIYWGDRLLFSYNPKLPSFINNILVIFRSNGRMVWLLYYVIFLLTFYMFLSYFEKQKNQAALALILALVLQTIDLYPNFVYNQNRTANADKINYQSRFSSGFWDMLPENMNHFTVIPYEQTNCNELALLSNKNGWTYSSFRTARSNLTLLFENSFEEAEKLKSGNINENVFYRHGYDVDYLYCANGIKLYDHFLVDGQLITAPKGSIRNKAIDFFVIPYADIIDIPSFISSPEENKLYVLSVKSDFGKFMNDEANNEAFKSMGLSLVDGDNDYSYYSIWGLPFSGIVIEDKSLSGTVNKEIKKGDSLGNIVMPVSLSVKSMNPGYASIVINGIETSPNFPGFSITVIDIESGIFSDIVVCDKFWVPDRGVKLSIGNEGNVEAMPNVLLGRR